MSALTSESRQPCDSKDLYLLTLGPVLIATGLHHCLPRNYNPTLRQVRKLLCYFKISHPSLQWIETPLYPNWLRFEDSWPSHRWAAWCWEQQQPPQLNSLPSSRKDDWKPRQTNLSLWKGTIKEVLSAGSCLCAWRRSQPDKVLCGSPEHHRPWERRLEEGRGAQPCLRQTASCPPRARGLPISALRTSLVAALQGAEAAEESLRLGAAGPCGLCGWGLGSRSALPHLPALGLSTGVPGCCFLRGAPGPRLSPDVSFRWLPPSSWQPFEVTGGGCPALSSHNSRSPCCLPGGPPWLFPEQSW